MTSFSQSSSLDSAFLTETVFFATVLAQALHASGLSDQEKQAWAVLVPHVRLDQVAKLASLLDKRLSRAVQTEVSDVVASVRHTVDKHAAIQSQINNTFMTDIATVVQELRAAESEGRLNG